MSIQHMALVFSADGLCAQEKAVLLAVCNHTDPTGKTFAGEQTLRREAGMPRTTFQRWRAKLVERGLLISRDKRNDKNQRLTSDTWVNLSMLAGMRDPWFDRRGMTAAEEDENPFNEIAGQSQAPSVEPGDETQAPSVGDPGPVSGAYPGPVSGAPNSQMNPPSSIARAAEAPIDSVAGDVAEMDDDGGINAEQAHEILCAVIAIRPEWHAPGIQHQLRQVSHLPYASILEGFTTAARDRAVRAPMHLASAAEEHATRSARMAAADSRREEDRDDWRRQVHEDAENRSAPETRAEKLARLKEAASEGRQAYQSKYALKA